MYILHLYMRASQAPLLWSISTQDVARVETPGTHTDLVLFNPLRLVRIEMITKVTFRFQKFQIHTDTVALRVDWYRRFFNTNIFIHV